MDTPEDPGTVTFEQHRRLLLAMGYRMLGSRAEAEELVQDTWLRWRTADTRALRSPRAWLITAATRLAIDRLRHARRERMHYEGPWLPEPWAQETTADPADAAAELLDESGWAPGPDAEGAAYWLAKGDWDSCVALGDAAVTPLLEALKSQAPQARSRSARALGRIGTDAVEPLAVVQHGSGAADGQAAGLAARLRPGSKASNRGRRRIGRVRG